MKSIVFFDNDKDSLMERDWYFKQASPDRYLLLKEFAAENKKHMTEAEYVLWQALRAKRLNGYRFVRQYIIGDYIVDFANLYMKLVIEVDGGYHSEPRQIEDDRVRTHHLEEMGFSVMRFTNEEVLFDLDATLQTIEQYLDNNN